jgi:hypothetical protein
MNFIVDFDTVLMKDFKKKRLSGQFTIYLKYVEDEDSQIKEEFFDFVGEYIQFDDVDYFNSNITKIINKFDQDTCPICLEMLEENIFDFPCFHSYHEFCAKYCNFICPICKTESYHQEITKFKFD